MIDFVNRNLHAIAPYQKYVSWHVLYGHVVFTGISKKTGKRETLFYIDKNERNPFTMWGVKQKELSLALSYVSTLCMPLTYAEVGVIGTPFRQAYEEKLRIGWENDVVWEKGGDKRLKIEGNKVFLEEGLMLKYQGYILWPGDNIDNPLVSRI